jgi:hypothetical protein
MKLRRTVMATGLACIGLAVHAHDTWFEPLPAAPGEWLLALGTGNRFPHHESGIAAEYLVRQGCRGAAGDLALTALRNEAVSLVLRAAAGARTCWAQAGPFEIELPPAKVALYLREINAPAAVHAAWAEMQRRGAPWRERYVKHARIERAATSAGTTAGDDPAAMAMDMWLEGNGAAIRPGDPLHFRVLRGGRPVAGLALELRGAASALGIWRRTDHAGRVQLPAPPAGRWLLRGTDVRLSATEADLWESGFVTLAFEVLPPLD